MDIVSALGPIGTYTHQAAKQFLGDKASYKLEDTITDIFRAVDQGTSQYGVCPIMNSTNGLVRETQDCLSTFKVEELNRTGLRIGHALLRKKNSRNAEVATVYSHEQALGQCRVYIAGHFSGAMVQAVNSTALAAQMARDNESCVAISSLMCADLYGLDVIDTDIQDGQANETTFILFQRSA